jgi:iron complex outermembrane receptor protein
MRTSTTITAILLAGTAITAPAMAQDNTSAPAATSGPAAADSGNEIIVTARRRAENIEKVPIAITAIAGGDLQKRAIYNENDLQSAVPGLVIRQNGGTNAFNYVIRGQSVDTFTNSPPSVLPYIDEVQIVSHSASTFYDMGGIQVLKGPQGTLFGRNATGGAVLFQTAPATDEYGGYVSGRYGSFASHHVEAAVNIPLGDLGALRVAGSITGGGAFVTDYFTGQKYGDNQQNSVRGTLKLTPAAGFTNTTVFQYTDEHGTNTPYELWSVNPNDCAAAPTTAYCLLNPATSPGLVSYLASHPAVYQGGLNEAVSLQHAIGPWESLASYPPFHYADQRYVINTSELELNSELKLKNIFGYNLAKSDDGFDYDGSPYHFFETQGAPTPDGVKVIPTKGFTLNTRQISDEFQVQGKGLDGKLDYVVGVYYLDQRDQVVSNLTFGQPVFQADFIYTAQWDTQSIAGFAQATYKATDKLSLTGGFRYTHDKTTMVQLPGSAWLFTHPDNTPEETSASKPSWTVSLDYQLTHSLLLYVTHRGSWRAGGYNYSVNPENVTAASGGNLFLPETTKDVEIGAKYSGNEMGIPVTLNGDGYIQWTDNIQRSAYILTANGVSLLTVNVPSARIEGLEGDVAIRPAEFLTIGGSVNYTHAKYTSNAVDILGNTILYGPFADVPDWSGTIYAEIGTSLGGNAGRLTLRGDWYGQTEMHFSNVGDSTNPNTTLPGYGLFNARLTWSDIAGSRLQFSLFARNMFNEKYYLGGNPASNGGNTNVVNPGTPRMWGGEIRADF